MSYNGLRNGGGIGDVLLPNYYVTEDPWPYIARLVHDLSFFFIMIIILLDLIFGMIIDAFGNLRDERNSNEEDQENNCFICGMSRSVLERFMNFEEHTSQEHNPWDYLFFIVYCKERFRYNRNDLNAIENIVIEKVNSRLFDWFPVSRSLTLEKRQQAAGDDIAVLHKSIKALREEFSKREIGESTDVASQMKNEMAMMINEMKKDLSMQVSQLEDKISSMESQIVNSLRITLQDILSGLEHTKNKNAF